MSYPLFADLIRVIAKSDPHRSCGGEVSELRTLSGSEARDVGPDPDHYGTGSGSGDGLGWGFCWGVIRKHYIIKEQDDLI